MILPHEGDFNTVPERHLAGASIPRLCPDLLITESTYATSIREDRRSRERHLLNMVRGGKEGVGGTQTQGVRLALPYSYHSVGWWGTACALSSFLSVTLPPVVLLLSDVWLGPLSQG